MKIESISMNARTMKKSKPKQSTISLFKTSLSENPPKQIQTIIQKEASLSYVRIVLRIVIVPSLCSSLNHLSTDQFWLCLFKLDRYIRN